MQNIKMDDDANQSHRLSIESKRKKSVRGPVGKAQSSMDVSTKGRQLQEKIFVVDLDEEVE